MKSKPDKFFNDQRKSGKGYRKLSTELAEEIRGKVKDGGCSKEDIISDYNISKTTYYDIMRNKVWKVK